MKCNTLHRKVIFFLDSDLPDEEMHEVQQHLSGCKECAAFAADMKKTLGVVENEKAPEVNPFFYTRVKARLENEEAIVVQARPVWAKVLQPVFFTGLLLIGVYGGFKVTEPAPVRLATYEMGDEVVPYLNELQAEPLESFLME